MSQDSPQQGGRSRRQLGQEKVHAEARRGPAHPFQKNSLLLNNFLLSHKAGERAP